MIPVFLKIVWRSYSVRKRHEEFSFKVPVSLGRWLEIRDFERSRYKCKDVLFPVGFHKGTLGYHGSNASLKTAFSGVELGTWAIDEDTIDFLWNRLGEIRPKTVLEFGSGSSTIVFSEWMKENHPDGLVVSIDQNEWAANQTLERLRRFGLESQARVLVFGQDSRDRFVIDRVKIGQVLGNRKVDVLFSDGPAGREGCRDNTLPESIPLLADSAHWFLHDSLRDPELEILRDWSTNPGVDVHGIVPFGNGLAVGLYTAPTE